MNRRQALERASQLSTRLHAGGASRSEVRPFLDVLLHTPGTWAARCEATRQLLELSPRSNMATRSKVTPAQLELVGQALLPLLQGDSPEKEVTFIVAWISRMLAMRDKGVVPPGGGA